LREKGEKKEGPQEMKVYPEMLMKTKDEKNGAGRVRR
jgi:hypothetical protein